MKKTIIAAMIIGLATSVYASIEEQRAEWIRQHFAKQGDPIPDGGVQIIPEKQMSQYKTFRYENERNRKDGAKFGYIKRSSPEASGLLSIKSNAHKMFANDSDAQSTSMRHSISDLSMAYTFVGVPHSEMSEEIGVAPYLTYLKDQGWVGAIQYFINSDIGNCSFAENNVRLSHGSVVVAKEVAREDVNGKVTVVTVSGDNDDGFLYEVEWYDQSFFRTLQCANKIFSNDLKAKVIELAKRIDLAQ